MRIKHLNTTAYHHWSKTDRKTGVEESRWTTGAFAVRVKFFGLKIANRNRYHPKSSQPHCTVMLEVK